MSEYANPIDSPPPISPSPSPPPQPRPPRRADTLPVRFENSPAGLSRTVSGRRDGRATRQPLPERRDSIEPRRRPRPYVADDDEDVYVIERDFGGYERRPFPSHPNGMRSRVAERDFDGDMRPPLPRERVVIEEDYNGYDRPPPPISRSRINPFSPADDYISTNARVSRPGEPIYVSEDRPSRSQRYDGRWKPPTHGRYERSRTPSPYSSVGEDDPSYPSVHYRRGERSRSSRLRQVRISNRMAASPIVNDRLYADEYSDEEDRSDFDVNSEAYSFSLSRRSKSVGPESVGSGSDISENGDSTEEIARKIGDEPGSTTRVYRSQYTGDGILGGIHKVQLATLPEIAPTNGKGATPIFQWVHFEDKNMDFEQFQRNVLNIAGLTDLERNAVSRLLGRTYKKYDSPLQFSKQLKTRYMTPSFTPDTILGEVKPKASKARNISWMCVPYFCLEKYGQQSGLRISSHPMKTLLQARYWSTEKKRDLQQAVCQLTDTPNEHCFHIAQVWLLILDDSLLISCSRYSKSFMQGEAIKLIPASLSESSNSVPPNILVSSKGVAWSLPVDRCQTWFSFISHFWEYWPRNFEVKYNEKTIKPGDWSKYLAVAKKSGLRLSLESRSTTKESTKGILLEEPLSEETPNQDTDAQTPAEPQSPPSTANLNLRVGEHTNRRSGRSVNLLLKDGFHVFTWSNRSPEADLDEMDAFLKHKTSMNDRCTYRDSSSGRRRNAYEYIARTRVEALGRSSTQTQREWFEMKVDILNAADALFQFFFPSETEGTTIGNYWAAVTSSLNAMASIGVEFPTDEFQMPSIDAATILEWLTLISQKTTPFRELLSYIEVSDSINIELPEELSTAWLHLVMALLYTPQNIELFEHHISLCHDLLDLGMRKTVRQLSDVKLSDYVVFSPFDLASLITFQLAQDTTDTGKDISEVYMEYLKGLESDMDANPLDRGHQDRLDCMKQEIAVITETLEIQSKVLRQAQAFSAQPEIRSRVSHATHLVTSGNRSRSYAQNSPYTRRAVYNDDDPSPQYHSPLPPVYQQSPAGSDPQQQALSPSGVKGLLVQEALTLVHKRLNDFGQIRDRATDLGEWNIQKIDSNKDRQEAAVYAFTIVTIIFLPLSTVAGILGMNTNDVRNMEVDQWVFWATALPLTVLIITICLIWAGEFSNFWEGFGKLWRKTPKNYRPVPEDYGVLERYDDRVRPSRRSRTIYGGRRDTYV